MVVSPARAITNIPTHFILQGKVRRVRGGSEGRERERKSEEIGL